MKTPQQTTENRPNKGNRRKRFDHRRPPRKFWRSLLTNKLFDLIILITALSVAFQINSWKQAADQAKRQHFYIENIAADLTKDINQLNKGVLELKNDYQGVVGYLEKYGRQNTVDDSLVHVISVIMSLDVFDGNHSAYSAMTALKELNTIDNPALRTQLTEYYSQYNNIKRFEETYIAALSDINRYFSPYCDYTFFKIADKSVLSRVETKNNLLLAAGHLEDGIERYEEALTKAETLKKNIEAGL